MASYSITNISINTIEIAITADSTYTWFRVFVREGSATVYDFWRNIPAGTTQYISLSGFTANTSYVMNVGADTIRGSESGQTWLGSQSFTTMPVEESDCGFYIFTGGAWVKSEVYLISGGAWTFVAPALMSGGMWAEGG